MRRALLCLLLVLPLRAGLAQERWQTLPPTAPPIVGAQTGHAQVNGISLYYAIIGEGSPVVLLHGGLANSDYFGHQVQVLAPRHRVILVDSRGHGRSTRDARPFGYDLMADDVVALLDHLRIDRADIVGWSDGAILGLDLAMRHPSRVRRVLAFAANTQTASVIHGVENNPTFAAFIRRAGEEYARLSPTPDQFQGFVQQIGRMWESEPNWTDAQLRAIRAPTIPGAGLLILPNVSHFALLQDPAMFNFAILHFLGDL